MIILENLRAAIPNRHRSSWVEERNPTFLGCVLKRNIRPLTRHAAILLTMTFMWIIIAIRYQHYREAYMRTVQMTLDDKLIASVDKAVKSLKTTRSAFTHRIA